MCINGINKILFTYTRLHIHNTLYICNDIYINTTLSVQGNQIVYNSTHLNNHEQVHLVLYWFQLCGQKWSCQSMSPQGFQNVYVCIYFIYKQTYIFRYSKDIETCELNTSFKVVQQYQSHTITHSSQIITLIFFNLSFLIKCVMCNLFLLLNL